MMTSSSMIEQWADRNIEKIQGFLGVYTADRHPSPAEIEPPAVGIINYDPANMPGSHWVAVSIQPSSVSWFDSYGLGPDSGDLLIGHRTYFRAWLSRVCQRLGLKNYEYNQADLQSPSETTCGHWALYFSQQGPETGWEVFGPGREKSTV